MLSRSTIIALTAFFTITIVLFRQYSATPHFYHDAFGRGHSLDAWLNEEEARYDEVLRDRQELIERWGPTRAQVESFPTHREEYVLWDFFIPAFQCPHRVERVGTMGDGGKWVCGLERVAKQEKCVVYSFGINGESSFERALLKRAPGCEVWGYDYSVNGWGPEIKGDPELAHRAHFEPFALGGTDKHGAHDNPKWWTLDSLMKLNGHTFVDILKIDIEGGEFDALTSFIASHVDEDLPIGQLQLEIHAWDGHENFPYFVQWWESLEAAGLRPFWTEPNVVFLNIAHVSTPTLTEYSFMNIWGKHAIVDDAFN